MPSTDLINGTRTSKINEDYVVGFSPIYTIYFLSRMRLDFWCRGGARRKHTNSERLQLPTTLGARLLVLLVPPMVSNFPLVWFFHSLSFRIAYCTISLAMDKNSPKKHL